MNNNALIAIILFGIAIAVILFIKLKRRRSNNKHKIKTPVKVNPNVRIISCPACAQQIRFTVPLKNNKAKCKKCSAKFRLDVDANGHVYITELSKPEEKNTLDTLDECYAVLDISPDSNAAEIRTAYKKKIMEYHPDKVDNLGVKIKKVAESETRRINAAFAMLQENKHL